MRPKISLFLLLLALSAGYLAAQELETEDVDTPQNPPEDALVGEMFDTHGLAMMDNDEVADTARGLIEGGNYVGGREVVEELLRRDPESPKGHLLLGVIHHRSEGNLPRALYHVKKARKILDDRLVSFDFADEIVEWHFVALSELAAVAGSMGLHKDKIRYIRERERLYEFATPAELGWPLMRMRDYEEARAAVEDALLLDDPGQVAQARTALCAIEAEQQKREEGYRACMEAAEHERLNPMGGPVPFTNAAEAALSMLKFDEAERLNLEGTKRFRNITVSNPWLDLTHLYIAGGRTGEALEAVRRMVKWRRQQPAFMDQQNRAEAEMTSSIFLLVAGYPEKASRVSARVIDHPDRTGFTSSETEQMEAGHALVDALTQRAAAEVALERAAWLPFWDGARARLEARERRLRSWSSGRRVASLVADERILLATLRPYLAGSMESPEWIEPELVEIVGPGIIEAALKKVRAVETLPEAEGYFLAYEAEIAFLRGRKAKAIDLVDQAVAALPSSEVLKRARLSARAADASRRLGQKSRAAEYFDQMMQIDPGVVRRLSMALPVRFEATSGTIAKLTKGYLEDSPRFDDAGEGWFRVQVDGGSDLGKACLLGPFGTVYSCVEVTPRAGEETPTQLARRLAEEFHAAAFAPRMDLTQSDLRSLDGSPTAGGGRSRERLQTVLEDLVEEP